LEAALGYRFHDPRWLERAMTHRSFLNEPKDSGPDEDDQDNERLEFLGDAVLNLTVSDELVSRHPDATEGALSKMRARLVSEPALAQAARRLELGRCLRLGRGEELSGGREKRSLLADALEALIAAVYLDGGHDGGYEAARRCVLAVLEPELAELPARELGIDYKTEVQERCQQRFGLLPVYRVSRESGPDHHKLFQVELTIGGRPFGEGAGKTKKEAEQQAAKAAWGRLQSAEEGGDQLTKSPHPVR
jgi:ribonuclease-3